MSPQKSLLASFSHDLFLKGTVSIPSLLLRSYKKLGLTDQEMLLLIQLFYLAPLGDIRPAAAELAEVMSAEPVIIEKDLASFLNRGLLRVQDKTFRFEGLFDKLAEVWAAEKIKEMEAAKQSASVQTPAQKESADNVAKVYKLFEQEFGRPLTPMEGKQIIDWCDGDRHPAELILEALKRAALQGVRNFRYIDSILREWSKQGVRTISEVQVIEERFKEKKAAKISKPGRTKEKTTGGKGPQADDDYRDLYLG